MIRNDGGACSFCQRPHKFAIRLYSSESGTICDRCINEAVEASEPPSQATAPVCSFCEDGPSGTAIKLEFETVAICSSCAVKLQNLLEDDLEKASREFVDAADGHHVGEEKIRELIRGATAVRSELNQLVAKFDQGSIDWQIYNTLEQQLGNLKGLAARAGMHELADLLWEIVSALSRIQFDDIELNKPAFDLLVEHRDKLEVVTDEAAKQDNKPEEVKQG